jgi:hypothetical protein
MIKMVTVFIILKWKIILISLPIFTNINQLPVSMIGDTVAFSIWYWYGRGNLRPKFWKNINLNKK